MKPGSSPGSGRGRPRPRAVAPAGSAAPRSGRRSPRRARRGRPASRSARSAACSNPDESSAIRSVCQGDPGRRPGRSSQRPAFAAAATISRRPSPSTSPAVRQRQSWSGRTAIVSPPSGGRARAVAADLDVPAAHGLDGDVELVLVVAVEVGDQDLLGVAVPEVGDHRAPLAARRHVADDRARLRRAVELVREARRRVDLRAPCRRRGRRPRSRARRCWAGGPAPSR